MRPTLSLLKRSIWKGPNLIAFDLTGPKTHPIKTQARAAAITPYMVGYKFLVHNGKVYNDVYVTEEMVGRKLGEFSPTRKRFTYKLSKNK